MNQAEQIAPIIILPIFLIIGAIMLKMGLDFKKIKLKSQINQKLIDKFSDVNDFNTFLQSSSGTEFLRMLSIDTNPPKEKMISTIYRGIVLLFSGAGFWAIGFIIPEYSRYINSIGVILAFLGIGFLVSWYLAFTLSKKLGLIDKSI